MESPLPVLLLSILKYTNSSQRFNSSKPIDGGGEATECPRKKSPPHDKEVAIVRVSLRVDDSVFPSAIVGG